MAKDTAFITGASSGIGLELARQFAMHGHPLFLTAPKEDELMRVARDLESAYGVWVKIIAKDLEEPSSAQELFEAVSREVAPIGVLINNAGLGHMGKFWEVPLEEHLEMLRLNVEATLRLTRLFLPGMVERRHGKLLFTASVAGFEPGPTMATYHATKAFVLSLSESLAEELKDTGVTVTALCPGATDTDFISKAGLIATNVFQTGNVMAPQEVAEKGFDALMRDDRICVVGASNKAQVFARRILTTSAQARIGRKMYETAPSEKQHRHRGDVELAVEPAPLELIDKR